MIAGGIAGTVVVTGDINLSGRRGYAAGGEGGTLSITANDINTGYIYLDGGGAHRTAGNGGTATIAATHDVHINGGIYASGGRSRGRGSDGKVSNESNVLLRLNAVLNPNRRMGRDLRDHLFGGARCVIVCNHHIVTEKSVCALCLEKAEKVWQQRASLERADADRNPANRIHRDRQTGVNGSQARRKRASWATPWRLMKWTDRLFRRSIRGYNRKPMASR